MERRRLLTLAGSSVATGLAGCLDGLGGDTENQDAAGSSPDPDAEVAMISDDEGHYFDPELVWIEPGGTVTWTNDSGAHTATAYHPDYEKPQRIPLTASAWNSGMFSEPGQTFEYAFEEAGVYDYFCVPHEHRAMVGSVLVGHPDPHVQQGLRPPEDSLPEAAQSKLADLNARTNELLGHTHD